jgi:CDP-alcohol phosphatidyltransferase
VGDVLTCSRGIVAAALLGRATAGGGNVRLGGLPWAMLLAACTVADWFDGPLARREETASPYGAWLDREMDSWLTFALAIVTVHNGALPALVVAAPALTLIAPPRHHSHAVPAQLIGGIQMTVLLTALTPIEDIRNDAFLRRAVALVASLSLLSYLVQSGLLRAPRLI